MSLSTVMAFVLVLGVITVISCSASLIHDCRKQRNELRESRRKNLTESTINTILSYQSRQENAAVYYRRRA